MNGGAATSSRALLPGIALIKALNSVVTHRLQTLSNALKYNCRADNAGKYKSSYGWNPQELRKEEPSGRGIHP
jgi:hypothetical protein